MYEKIIYVPRVRYDATLDMVLLDDLYEDRAEAKAACVERIRRTRFGAPDVEARWWDSNVGSNYTSADGIQYAAIAMKRIKRKGA